LCYKPAFKPYKQLFWLILVVAPQSLECKRPRHPLVKKTEAQAAKKFAEITLEIAKSAAQPNYSIVAIKATMAVLLAAAVIGLAFLGYYEMASGYRIDLSSTNTLQIERTDLFSLNETMSGINNSNGFSIFIYDSQEFLSPIGKANVLAEICPKRCPWWHAPCLLSKLQNLAYTAPEASQTNSKNP
jgi:hypothetical protein